MFNNKERKNMQLKNKSVMSETMGFVDQEFPVVCTEVRYKNFRLFLDNTIEGPQDFRFHLQALYEANEDDQVTMHLCSYGGCVDATLSLIHAMRQCQAPVDIIATGMIASAAALILCNANSMPSISPGSMILFHTASGGSYGPMQDMQEYFEFANKRMREVLELNAIGVLSPAEIDDIILNKKELLLTAEEFVERFNRKMEYANHTVELLDSLGVEYEARTPKVYVEMMKRMFETEAKKDEASPPAKKPAKRVSKPRVKKESEA
jgi:ATP-dependent protease ClpP protease subunit